MSNVSVGVEHGPLTVLSPDGNRETEPTGLDLLLQRVKAQIATKALNGPPREHWRLPCEVHFKDGRGHTAKVRITGDQLKSLDRDLWQDSEGPFEGEDITQRITEALKEKGFSLDGHDALDIQFEIVDTM